MTLRDLTPDLAEGLGQPLVTANVYCSGRLCEVVEKLLKPAWQEIQVRAPESHLWIMRYARGGEHLKIRIHGQLPSRPGILETLALGQERYFSSLGADLPEVRHTRKGCPPIDLEDGDTEDHPDRTLLFTTYRRSYVVFGHEPYLSDSTYASLLTCCFVASTEIVLGHIRTNRNGQFPARPQRALFLRGLAAAVSALFPVVEERIGYLLYHRDSLLRGLRNRSKKFFNPTRMTSDRAQAEMVKLVGLDAGWEELPARVDLWCRHLESLFHHLALVRRDPGYYIDLYAEDIASPGLFKALHGFANQLGVDPLNEAFLAHLALSLFAEEEVLARPMQMRPEFLHPPRERSRLIPASAALPEGHPFIVRVSGLRTEILAELANSRCAAVLAEISSLEVRLGVAREDLVEQIHVLLPSSPPELRGDLLALKRDAFNGRPLARLDRRGRRARALEFIGPTVDRLLELECDLDRRLQGFTELYGAERSREGTFLRAFKEDPGFVRGVALASPEIATRLSQLPDRPSTSPGRRERRLEISLLRYVSRAAAKLSPFSSLTRIGLGRLTDGARLNPPLQLTANGWKADARTQIQRSFIEQLSDLLARHEPVRQSLVVQVNPTAEKMDDRVWRFLRPSFWECPSGVDSLVRQQPALVRAKLDETIVPWLFARYAAQGLPYADLLAEASRIHASHGRERLKSIFDELLRIGFLCFWFPWNAPALSERQLLEHLSGIDCPAVGTLREGLRHLLSLTDGSPALPSPGRIAADAHGLIRSALKQAAELAGARLSGENGHGRDWLLHEDVFLTSANPAREIATLSTQAARQVLSSFLPLIRLSTLYSPRLDFLYALRAFASSRWAGKGRIRFLDFFESALPFFRSFVAFDRKNRFSSVAAIQTFAPFVGRCSRELAALRQRAASALDDCLIRTGPDVLLDLDCLRLLVEDLPARYTEANDFCMFVQPFEEAGNGTSWVLNLVAEGAARFESRYTMVMGEELCREWTARYAERSVSRRQDGETELVDLFSTIGNTANLHHPLSRRTIEFPGQATVLEADRCLPLRDLHVVIPEPDEALPYLEDGLGTRIQPCHLGSQGFAYLPSLHKFLALFGPWELRPAMPTVPFSGGDGRRVRGRHWAENVLYRRKSWQIPLAPIERRLKGASDSAAYRIVDEWRRENDLPDRLYVADPTVIPKTGAPHLKPQFIDFRSCSLVELFRSIVDKEVSTLELVEAVPDPSSFSPNQGGGFALELQLDSRGIGLTGR